MGNRKVPGGRSCGSRRVFLEAKGKAEEEGMLAAHCLQRLTAEQLQGEQLPTSPNSHHSSLACSREPFLPDTCAVSERRHKAGSNSL